MLSIARASTVEALTGPETAALRRHFEEHHWARLPGMLAPSLLEDVQARLERATFVERVHDAVSPPSIDLCMVPNAAAAMLELACNDAAIFRAIEAITGAGPVGRFGGFVYRLSPEYGHQHHWHNDLVEGRLVAMSVNLGPGPYEGGLLELRDRASERLLDRLVNLVPGDALIFRIDPALQHRATPVTSGIKTAFAGWFFAGDSYADMLRRTANP
jgi:hypothetical protein